MESVKCSKKIKMSLRQSFWIIICNMIVKLQHYYDDI